MSKTPLNHSELERNAAEKSKRDSLSNDALEIQARMKIEECAINQEKKIDSIIERFQLDGIKPPYKIDIEGPHSVGDRRKDVFEILYKNYTNAGWYVSMNQRPNDNSPSWYDLVMILNTKEEHAQLAKFTDKDQIKSDKGGCFIATVCYGSYDSPEVLTLRQFRDHILLNNIIGSSFVSLYYTLSPPVADFLVARHGLKKLVRTLLVVPAVKWVGWWMNNRKTDI